MGTKRAARCDICRASTTKWAVVEVKAASMKFTATRRDKFCTRCICIGAAQEIRADERKAHPKYGADCRKRSALRGTGLRAA